MRKAFTLLILCTPLLGFAGLPASQAAADQTFRSFLEEWEVAQAVSARYDWASSQYRPGGATLRVEDGAWKLVHRHADQMTEKQAPPGRQEQ